MKIMHAAIVLALVVTIAVLSYAQAPTAPPRANEPGFRPLDLPVAAGIARQTTDAPQEGICRVTFCTEDLRRVLIHDAKGTLVINARSLEIKIAKIGDLPSATCKLYDGVFEPTGAPSKSWKVSEMRFVEPADFQKLVDQGSVAQRTETSTTTPPAVPGVNLNNVTPLIPDGEAPPPRATPTNPPRPGAP